MIVPLIMGTLAGRRAMSEGERPGVRSMWRVMK